MGCCGSKEDSSSPEEEGPLLNHPENDLIRGYPRYEAINHQREQETLKRIVDRTVANLIDISSTNPDRLQQQDAQDRANEYKDLLSQIQIPSAKIKSVSSGTNLAATVNVIPYGLSSSVAPQDILGRRDILGEEDVSQLYQAMDDVQDALDKIEVKDVGEIVVPLTFSDSEPIHAIHG